MLGFYQKSFAITTDNTVASDGVLGIVPAASAAVFTTTLPDAGPRVGNPVYIFNRSLYPQKVAANSNDNLFGVGLVMPGQLVKYESDGSDWYCFAASNGPQVANISLSAAQIIAMGTTPVSLIPAPGAGRVVIVSSILMQMTRTATAFTGGGALEFRYTDASGAKVSADIAAALVTTGGAGVAYAHVLGIEASITPVPNAAIVIDNATAAFAAGTGTAKLNIGFRVADFN